MDLAHNDSIDTTINYIFYVYVVFFLHTLNQIFLEDYVRGKISPNHILNGMIFTGNIFTTVFWEVDVLPSGPALVIFYT